MNKNTILKIFLLFIMLLFSPYMHSQFKLNGKYKILTISHFYKDSTIYKSPINPNQNNNIISFDKEKIIISINGYWADLLKFIKELPPRQINGDESASMHSTFDNKTKKTFIHYTTEQTFEVWIERGNGGYDIFEITPFKSN